MNKFNFMRFAEWADTFPEISPEKFFYLRRDFRNAFPPLESEPAPRDNKYGYKTIPVISEEEIVEMLKNSSGNQLRIGSIKYYLYQYIFGEKPPKVENYYKVPKKGKIKNHGKVVLVKHLATGRTLCFCRCCEMFRIIPNWDRYISRLQQEEKNCCDFEDCKGVQ